MGLGLRRKLDWDEMISAGMSGAAGDWSSTTFGPNSILTAEIGTMTGTFTQAMFPGHHDISPTDFLAQVVGEAVGTKAGNELSDSIESYREAQIAASQQQQFYGAIGAAGQVAGDAASSAFSSQKDGDTPDTGTSSASTQRRQNDTNGNFSFFGGRKAAPDKVNLNIQRQKDALDTIAYAEGLKALESSTGLTVGDSLNFSGNKTNVPLKNTRMPFVIHDAPLEPVYPEFYLMGGADLAKATYSIGKWGITHAGTIAEEIGQLASLVSSKTTQYASALARKVGFWSGEVEDKLLPELNRFHQTARNLSETGQRNIRILRNWAKSRDYTKLPNPKGGPEIWGEHVNGEFEWRLKIKPEASPRANSFFPRFDARISGGKNPDYINPFTGEIGGRSVGTHITLDELIPLLDKNLGITDPILSPTLRGRGI